MQTTDMNEQRLKQMYDNSQEIFSILFNEIGKVIVGQKSVVEQMIISILCDGHALVESNPGLGKTLTISTISKCMDLSFNRIQCTPDLMPADITGTNIIDETEGIKKFKFEHGPIFANIVLADEINRASPKTQSALLESMQEKQVTSGNKTFILDKPFFVLATQNPIEMEGTFPLPEAQLDRFLLKIQVDYPSFEDEIEIINRYTLIDTPEVRSIISKSDIFYLQRLTREVPISEELKNKVIKIVSTTRSWKEHIEYGASPRASIGLILASKAHALINGRNYVSEEDIKKMAYPILRHRIVLTFESERKGISSEQIISELIKKIN
ncbi:AAA family ATPase [Methanosalsum natronophilum]|uniref:MoxR family ATPase n=1 Tax=Methanosalsum natronophilum TaxID=768733 RepID=A0A424YY39_9EURY|nr:MoxR family ATPase [Methanosalsum natronophilum]MCS3924703.1 MoxR-like ATPase [Methanosalsum natronophilum]RQD85374.1 MAG: MoxR family ATPase [Methanosalsum natronophilum]